MVLYSFREILMKTRLILTILLIASLSFMAGCSKKEEPPKTPAESDASEATGMMDSMKGATEKAAETVKESLSMDIDLQKAVSDLKAEAAKMDVKDLQKIAAKYKDAITEKMAEGLISSDTHPEEALARFRKWQKEGFRDGMISSIKVSAVRTK